MPKTNRLRAYLGILLFIYSLVILYFEYDKGQDFVRNFITDIEGPVPFYAINTTLSVMMLGFTSLLFLISCFTIINPKENKTLIYFYISQFILFAYLSFDDRFMVHERMKNLFGFEGDIILPLLGILELVILFTWGKFQHQSKENKLFLTLAALLFGIMLIIDTLIPQKLFLRLSLEDLSKTWSDFFLFLFGWNILRSNINFLKAEIKK